MISFSGEAAEDANNDQRYFFEGGRASPNLGN